MGLEIRTYVWVNGRKLEWMNINGTMKEWEQAIE